MNCGGCESIKCRVVAEVDSSTHGVLSASTKNAVKENTTVSLDIPTSSICSVYFGCLMLFF